MKNSVLLLALFAAFFPSLACAESVEEIITRSDKEKVASLTAYLEANPEATDRDAALFHLVNSQQALGDNKAVTGLLEERYDSFEKGPDANLGELFNEIVQPLIAAYMTEGKNEDALAFVNRVGKDTAQHPMAPQIEQFLGQLRGQLSKPGPGGTLDISFIDLNQNQVDLAKMKGKVVLVDFWATWCGPCVAEMPNVIAAYKKHHSNGFEVIGISLDQEKEALLSFIEENDMPWPQYFDGKGWENELAGKYGITGIPATFLIGKDGKIAAADLRGEALEAKIAELLE